MHQVPRGVLYRCATIGVILRQCIYGERCTVLHITSTKRKVPTATQGQVGKNVARAVWWKGRGVGTTEGQVLP